MDKRCEGCMFWERMIGDLLPGNPPQDVGFCWFMKEQHIRGEKCNLVITDQGGRCDQWQARDDKPGLRRKLERKWKRMHLKVVAKKKAREAAV